LAVKTVARIGIAAWFPGPSGILIAGKYAGNLAGARYTVQNVSRRENRVRIAAVRRPLESLDEFCSRISACGRRSFIVIFLSLSLSVSFAVSPDKSTRKR